MEINERIGKLVEARDAVRLLDDLANLPPAVMAVRFDSAEKRKITFVDAVELLLEFIHDEIGAVDADGPDLAGELAEVKKENARLTRAVTQLEKKVADHVPATDPPGTPPPARRRQPQTASNADKLPKYVKREGGTFASQVRRTGLQFYKRGFDTAQAAHDYAVKEIEEAGGDASDGRYDQRRSNTNQGLPRFVYEQNGFFDVLCNRKNMYFRKSGFATADKASEWAEAEFVRKSAGITTTPTADPPPSAGPAPGNRGRPRTRAELQAAIGESRQRTEKRVWSECADCEKLLGDVDDEMPESCPNCGSKEVAKMEGVPGGDAVEVKTE